MASFIPPTPFLRPFHNATPRRWICPLPPRAAMKAPRRTDADDDDTTFGVDNPAYGFVMPKLTASDRAYVDGAKSDREFMERMRQIARRMDQDRQIESKKIGRQSADDYLEGLRRDVRLGDGNLRDVGPAEYEREVEKGRERVERERAGWEEKLREMAREEGEELGGGGESLDSIERKVREVQRELREVAGVSEEDLEPEDELVEGGVDEVDKQIEFVEQYLEKLKREEEAEGEGGVGDGEKGLKVEGLGGTGGEMSEGEKLAAFEAIRNAAAQRRGEGMFADPLARDLPVKGVEDEEEVEAQMSEEEEMAVFERVRQQALQRSGKKDAGRKDVQVSVQSDEDDRFYDILELEAEIKKYIFEAKDLLHKHEQKMMLLLDKLRSS